jgi:molybdopterin synthase catalytic subunit
VAGAVPTADVVNGCRRVLGVTHQVLDLPGLIAAVADARSGAIASFLGTVRSPNHGRTVHRIDYEGYEAMIEAELGRIADELHDAYGLLGLAMIHRLGPCDPGEASIAIVACSPHRDAAFEASRAALEACKARLPVWKHEHDDDGAHWVAGSVVDDARI